MPKQVEIEIFQIARTMVNDREVERWLRHLEANDFADTLPGPKECTDAAFLVALAAKRCYKSFEVGLNPNITKVREDLTDYLDNVLKQRHGSVFEHSVFSFAIEGVSRVFTAEMNRHRAGWAISEGSLRFIRFDEIPYWLPESLKDHPDDDREIYLNKSYTRLLIKQAFEHQENTYKKLVEIWNLDEGDKNFHYKKKMTSLFRRIVGMGVATGGIWTGNVRALRHVIASRADPGAEEEIFYVFSRIAQMMAESEPMLFGDFKQGEDGGWKPEYYKV
jgi:thymidylate synthase (FAD)